MLVLSRKLDQEIWIDGGRVKIKVVAIIKGKVRLGVIAPRDMQVDRQEIAEARAEFAAAEAPAEAVP